MGALRRKFTFIYLDITCTHQNNVYPFIVCIDIQMSIIYIYNRHIHIYMYILYIFFTL